MNKDHEGNGGDSLGASWDDPALYTHLRQGRECNRCRGGGRYTASSKASEALDLRLLAPAPACWADAGWAIGRGVADIWRQVLLLVSGYTALAALFVIAALRLRLSRHRANPRPGAPKHGPRAMGTLSASLLVYVPCAATILTINTVHLRARRRDPLTVIVASGQPVTLIGTVSQQPRVSAASRSTLVITALDVA